MKRSKKAGVSMRQWTAAILLLALLCTCLGLPAQAAGEVSGGEEETVPVRSLQAEPALAEETKAAPDEKGEIVPTGEGETIPEAESIPDSETAGDTMAGQIAQAAALGLVPEGFLTQNLEEPCTRGEFCRLVAQSWDQWRQMAATGAQDAGTKDTQAQSSQQQAPAFSDTEDPAVTLLAELGILKGYPDGTFQPEGRLTRAQAAAVLHRTAQALDVPEPDVLYPHRWEDLVPDWVYEDVTWCYFQGILEGVGDNRLAPENWYTRGQAIVTVLRLDRLLKGQAQKKTEYYPIYDSVGEENIALVFQDLKGFLGSDGTFLTDQQMAQAFPQARQAALEHCPHTAIGNSLCLPDTAFGKKLRYVNVQFLMNGYGWLEDVQGNRIAIPDVGDQFYLLEVYQDAQGQLAGNFVPLMDPEDSWSSGGPEMIFYNLTTGQRLSEPMDGIRALTDWVTSCAAGDGVVAIQDGSAISVYGAGPEPVALPLPEGEWNLEGFCNGLVAVSEKASHKIRYYTPFGQAVEVPDGI